MPPRTPSSMVAMASSTTSIVLAASKTSATAVGGMAPCSLAAAFLSGQQQFAGFSTTLSRPRFSRSRRAYRAWFAKQGKSLRETKPHVEYLPLTANPKKFEEVNTEIPFPRNREFVSAPVLDEAARELVWEKVMRKGQPIKTVSAEYGIDMRRVAAVVRLKEIEKEWTRDVSVPQMPKKARPVLGQLSFPVHSVFHFDDDCQHLNFRLVLKTSPWLQTCCEPL